MKEPTEEEIKRFWEHFGFHREYFGKKKSGGRYHNEVWESETDDYRWISPEIDSMKTDFGKYPPPIDLNNLFKWAVPNVIREIMGKWKITYNQARRKLFRWWLEEMERVSQKDEISLFRAIYKVIKSE